MKSNNMRTYEVVLLMSTLVVVSTVLSFRSTSDRLEGVRSGARFSWSPPPTTPRTDSIYVGAPGKASLRSVRDAQLCNGKWKSVPVYSSIAAPEANDMMDYFWEEILGGNPDTEYIYYQDGSGDCLKFEFVSSDAVTAYVQAHKPDEAAAQIWVGTSWLPSWANLNVPGATPEQSSPDTVEKADTALKARDKTLYWIKSHEGCLETTVEAQARKDAESMADDNALIKRAGRYFRSFPQHTPPNPTWANAIHQIPMGVSSHRRFPASWRAFEDRYGDVKNNVAERTTDICLMSTVNKKKSGRAECARRGSALCTRERLRCNIKGQNWTFMFANLATRADMVMDSYAQTLMTCKFSLAPHGYTPETFRIFESMVAGSVPIISRRSTDTCPHPFQYLLDLGFPGLVVDGWDELDTVVEPYLHDDAAYEDLRQHVIHWYREVFVKHYRGLVVDGIRGIVAETENP